MSKQNPSRASSGVRVRHRGGCPAKTGGECECSPGFEASVYSKRDGRKIRQTFATLADAKRWVTAQRKSRDDGSLYAPARITLADAASKFLALAESGGARNRSGDRFKPSTIRSYRTSLDLHVLPTLGHVRLSEITRGQMQRLVAQMQEAGRSASTIQNAVNSVRAVYGSADLLTSGSIPVVPTVGLRLPARRGRRDRIADVSEASRLLDALPATERAVWATALFAGLRHGELRALRWEDIDLAAGQITVRRSWDARTGETAPKSAAGARTVPIVGRLRDALAEHRLLTDRTSGLVFGRTESRPFCSGTVYNRASAAWEAAALAPIGLHEARHTFASWLIAAGIDFKKISTYMGHASITITLDRYGHLVPGSQAETVQAIDSYLERADTSARLAALDC
jgi:integrase